MTKLLQQVKRCIDHLTQNIENNEVHAAQGTAYNPHGMFAHLQNITQSHTDPQQYRSNAEPQPY
jgi:hypothetical protein